MTRREKINKAWAEIDKPWEVCKNILDPAHAEYQRTIEAAEEEYKSIIDTAWAEYQRIRLNNMRQLRSVI